MVCTHFHEIWLKSIFDRDRRLVLDSCFIRNYVPPVIVLENTERQYKELCLGKVVFVDYVHNFWYNLGQTLECLEFDETFLFNLDKHKYFLREFKVLKELKITAVNGESLKKFNFNVIPYTVRKISLTLHFFESDLEFINTQFITKAVGLNELEIRGIILNEKSVRFINQHQNLLTKLEIYITTPIIENLNELLASNVTDLSILCVRSAIQMLHKVIQKFPSAQKISLHNLLAFPTRNFDNLKSLDVAVIENELETLKALKYLTNLEELDMKLSGPEKNCFFGHITYLNPKLRVLKLSMYKKVTCIECFKNLVESYPNLKNFEINLPLFTEHLKLLSKTNTKLNTLKMGYAVGKPHNREPPFPFIPSNLTELRLDEYQINEDVIKQWPLMPHLKVLSIRLFPTDLSLGDLTKLLQNVPCLEEIYFLKYSFITKEMVTIIAQQCPRLRKFIVFDCSNKGQVTYKEIKTITDTCQFIEKIRFSEIQIRKQDHWKLLGLFYKRTSLKKVQTHLFKLTRSDAYATNHARQGVWM